MKVPALAQKLKPQLDTVEYAFGAEDNIPLQTHIKMHFQRYHKYYCCCNVLQLVNPCNVANTLSTTRNVPVLSRRQMLEMCKFASVLVRKCVKWAWMK
jgi:hypothetical protein